ncbi:hypothetical protein BOTBODRAFT_300370 [Botryobasidium botryosum FD-172 SS1]|uniref:Uncharacterized protein n=1 Tax=Botryobasidium botryosum (strain FD-172 SS1) TaxID=930990 RepID=A0A067MGU4_BOTB1|nr:hypothetical protein BOTBODRAFT_300370 [Botryobasidium botryosum FD-172 SS1]
MDTKYVLCSLLRYVASGARARVRIIIASGCQIGVITSITLVFDSAAECSRAKASSISYV